MSKIRTFNLVDCFRTVQSGSLFSGNKCHLAEVKRNNALMYVVIKEANLERIFSKKNREIESIVAEVQELKKLDCNFLTKTMSCWQENGSLYVEREYVDGPNVLQIIEHQNGEPLAQELVIEWICQLSMALRFLHERQQMTHGNLKAEVDDSVK